MCIHPFYILVVDIQSLRKIMMYISDCPLQIVLPNLHNTIQCHLQHTCTGIECCIYVDILDRYVSVFLQVDTCNMRLIAGVENLMINESLLEFNYGSEKHIHLMGVFRMRFFFRKMA
ncbi:hypothetical protein MAR_020501 [Mya arenaria]|uniref:Uncharacterized protein n=1 Tax=Mya arenaria TaxID=6604 RepID=A0ABY7E852_MYAAR|nr:hypothetical protein MAR_020501 [Mya arenaria]